MRVWRNWQTHQILVASLQCIYSLQALAGKNRGKIEYAGVAELADARDLGSRAARCAGSIPVTRTNEIPRNSEGFFIC